MPPLPPLQAVLIAIAVGLFIFASVAARDRRWPQFAQRGCWAAAVTLVAVMAPVLAAGLK